MNDERGTMNENTKAFVLKFIVDHSSFIILLFVLLLSGCGARRTPNLERIFAATRERKDKRPIIVIPGILGSQIVNRRTGEVVWPSAFRSSDDGLSLPVTPDLAANHDDLVAVQIVKSARLARFAPEVYIYHQLLDALRNFGGYREGSWNNPPEGGDRDTFYVFAYDWRRDNVESAREFVRRIEDLKRKLGRPDLRFNIIAHSMGGLVARYAAMYGDSDLPPEGERLQPTWAGASFINKIFMFGTPNEGSAEAFATLLEGYSVTEGLRPRVHLLNKLSREDALTLPALFQLLPHAGSARFLDGNLKPLEVDLYNPAVWKHYGWSAIHDSTYRERFARGLVHSKEMSHSEGSMKVLDTYFATVLSRARRFHEALAATDKSEHQPVALYAFGGDCEETLSAPVILRDEKKQRWVTLIAPRKFLTTDNRHISRKEAIRAMYEPGDGRVTRRSLLGETIAAKHGSSLFNTALPITYAVFACDLHSELQNNKTLQDNALTLLISEATK